MTLAATATETPGGNWTWNCHHCTAKSKHYAPTETTARRGAYMHIRGRHDIGRKPRIQSLRHTEETGT